MPDRLTEVTVCALRAKDLKDFIRKIVCQSVLSQLLLSPPKKYGQEINANKVSFEHKFK